MKDFKKMVSEIVARAGSVDCIYLTGCGGSLVAGYAARYFVENTSRKIRVVYMTSNELVHCMPLGLDKHAVVLASSHQGNTPETVEALRVARERGATTVGFTFAPGSPLTRHADYVVEYAFDKTGSGVDASAPTSDLKASMILQVAVEFVHQVEGYAHYDAFCGAWKQLDEIVPQARLAVVAAADRFAAGYCNDPVIYTMGSGTAYGSAHQQSICILMEMQWIHSSAIHSGEYFHGPFEITDDRTAFLVLKSVGRTRALDERAIRFLQKHGKRFEILDSEKLGLGALDPKVAEYFNGILHTCVLDVYNQKLAVARNHPLSERRYMWREEY